MGLLFNELKRRNIFRVAGVYAVVGWLVAQIVALAANSFAAPTWVMQMLIVGLIVGFPIALVFAWAFEMTPEGVKRTEAVTDDESITDQTGRKLDFAILGGLALVAGLAIFQISRPDVPTPAVTNADIPQTPLVSSSPEATVVEDEKSIAVLPFVALSNDESDEYFGKGIAEELLNSLAQFPNLKVAARTSAFSFEGKNVDLREVGKTLGVAHVLEGSVRRSGERLRITAQLIRAADGFHLWSETYDRDQTDIFVIQDEIVAELSRILQFQLGIGAGVDRATRSNVDPLAYEEYLKGLNYWWKRDEAMENRLLAISAFENAIQFDSTFADAWSSFAVSLILSPGTLPNNMTPGERRTAIGQAITRALELDPNNVRAYAAGAFDRALPVDVIDSYLQKALDLAPNSPFVNYAAAFHYLNTGDHRKSIAAFQRTQSLDPLNKTVATNRNKALGAMGLHQQVLNELKPKVVCEASLCDGNHANDAWAGVLVAMQSNQKDEIPVWFGHFNNAIAGWGDNQPEDFDLRLELVQNFAAVLMGEPVNQDYWSSFTELPTEGDSATYWAAMLAQHGQVDIVLTALEQQLEQEGELTATTQDTYALLPGPFEFPESIRRHPRYHALWERPELASLAKARRANGQTAGLPLPIEGAGNGGDEE